MHLLSLLFSFTTQAAVPCAPRETVAGSSKGITNLLLKASVVDDADRRVAADYAKEHGETEETIKDRYAATGDLNCPSGYSQANVTIKGDIVTTAAHAIFPGDKGCGKKNEALKCKFVTEFKGKTETYEIDSVVATGYDCGMYDHKTGSDWAILKLKKAVDPRIKPYRIDKQLAMEQGAGSPVTAVGKSVDFPNNKVSIKDAPRHYGDCEAKAGGNFDFNFIQTTNCDTGHRASGGGLLTRGPDPILLGVHEGGAEWNSKLKLEEKKRCPGLTKNKTSGAYSACWYSSATMVTGDFAASLEEIQNQLPATEPTAPSPAPARPASPAPSPQLDL